MTNFDFINDEKFREILLRDYQELNTCLETKSAKSVLILAGSIIETILTDYFINFPVDGLTEKKILGMDLYPLIELSKENGLISQSTKELSTVIKNYRNLIHPGREIRKNEKFDYDTAVVAKSLLNIILKEIRENYLNNIGYSASDLILKLETDALSQPIFEKILQKVHKTEKNKLYISLIEYDLEGTPFGNQLENPKKYIRILKPQIDRLIIENQLHKLIHKIETGKKWEVVSYYNLLHEEINYLKPDEIELILLYILNAFREYSEEKDSIEIYVNQKLFSTFGTHLNSDSLKHEFLNLICSLVRNYSNKDFVYYTAYDQLINSVNSEKKEKIKEYVLNNVSSYYHEKFYNGYDDGNFLPF
jgi:hypothetical protein